MSKTRVVNQAPYHKYFTQMLNMAEDDLDPFQYRLLAHYVRWTGHGGKSDESIRQTAVASKMSPNKVQAALSELECLGYIKVDRPTPEEARQGKPINVTVLDRWADNIFRYQAVSNMTQENSQAVSNMTQGGVSYMTHLKEQGNKEPKKKTLNTSAAGATDSGDKPPRPRDLIFDAVAIGQGMEEGIEGGRIAKLSNWLKGSYTGKGAEKTTAISAPATVPMIELFFSDWRKEHKGINPPLDFIKFVEQWRIWAASKRQPSKTIRPTFTSTIKE